jgi:urease beta subunit
MEKVFEFIRDNGQVSRKDINAAFPVAFKGRDYHTCKLVEAGRIRRVKGMKGVYEAV